ncbi:hypothetical protein MASRES_GEN12946_04705 [Acinetobacter baumannii]|nr:Uncharacterised protein [Acinetobacter baumannii]SSP04574.1 putative cell wall-associated hydrolase [Acinetobacter baumannii]SSQ98696.1 putative cell wall-associated hydrolase [Acinetobacter baumannii]SSS20146.1 putative cell wall-associated hydrolase [Acinetobacter baumannii]SSS21206.1 putative cell wall-associated hydrolase [Acinetobacter baumannii]
MLKLKQGQIIAEAMTWLGTPYHHQGRVFAHCTFTYRMIGIKTKRH